MVAMGCMADTAEMRPLGRRAVKAAQAVDQAAGIPAAAHTAKIAGLPAHKAAATGAAWVEMALLAVAALTANAEPDSTWFRQAAHRQPS